jgi:hypothetical protein
MQGNSLEYVRYPPLQFSAQANARIQAARLRASTELRSIVESQAIDHAKAEEVATRYVLSLFSAFTKEACELGRQRAVAVPAIEEAAEEFLWSTADFAGDLCSELGLHVSLISFGSFLRNLQSTIHNIRRPIKPHILRMIKTSPEWRQFQSDLLEIADLQGHPESIAEGSKTAQRRGYRTEILAWMKKNGIDTVKQAARRLGVSESTLKSIMSSKGEARYGPDTLSRVLKDIGYGTGGE